MVARMSRGQRFFQFLLLLGAGVLSLPAADFPRLSISHAPAGAVVSWPASAVDWALDQADSLAAPVPWSRVAPGLYQTNAEGRFFQASSVSPARFYRLRWAAGANEALTGLWSLDEAAGLAARDTAGVGETLVLSNVFWGPGRVGNAALWFEPPASHASIPQAVGRVLPAGSGPFSVSFWCNPEALPPGRQALAGTDVGGTNGWRLLLSTPGPGTNEWILAGGGAGSSLSVTGRSLLLPGQWRHLTATYGGGLGRLYLDGALLAEGTGVLGGSSGPFYLGGGLPGLNGFLGGIDDLRIHTNSLSAELVSLAGHWRLDEAAGTQAGDSGLWGQHGRLSAGAAWVGGRVGTGLLLGPGLLTVSNQDRTVLPPDGGPFSVSFYCSPRVWPDGVSGLMSCGVAGSNGWHLAVEKGSNGTWLEWSSTNRAGTLLLRVPVAMGLSNWTKLDLTFNGGMATAYADGRKLGFAFGAIRSTRAPLVAGVVPGLAVAQWALDELKVYRHERAAAEIGPVAETMWETVVLNGTTNLPLRVSGPPGRGLTCVLVPVLTPTNGTVTLAGPSTVTYVAGNRKGPDAFTYTVSDGEFTSPPTIVVVSVVKPRWLSPAGAGLRDGTSPENAWVAGTADALDAIWNTNQYYDAFFYAPGEYPTRGWGYYGRETANPGCKHVGSGSAGPAATRVKLVDVLHAWTEGAIFGTALHDRASADGFEVHRMILDCNGDRQPILNRGEPVWVRVPLAARATVTSVTLRWKAQVIQGSVPWVLGRPSEFSVTARRDGTNAWTTNVVVAAGAGLVDVVPVGVVADELEVACLQRAPGVGFYSLAEISLNGGSASVPVATAPGGGVSQLDATRSALALVDRDEWTPWASGTNDASVELTVPLPAGSRLTEVGLRWNCQTLVGIGRLGPAEGFSIRARNETSGLYAEVPFVRGPRMADGWETCRFGTLTSTQVVTTDRLRVFMTNRAPDTLSYSLKAVEPRGPAGVVALRVPSALNQFFDAGAYGAVRTVDGDTNNGWASFTQGSVDAIITGGNNQKFIDLRIVGFGCRAAREGFPLGVVAAVPRVGPALVGNVLIENCRFDSPASNNTEVLTACIMVPRAPNQLTNAIVRRCHVADMRGSFPHIQAYTTSHLEESVAEYADKGVYYEPYTSDQYGPLLIRSNRFVNVVRGVYVWTHPDARIDRVVMQGNEFILSGGGGYGFFTCDICSGGPGGTITNAVALGNVVRYADWAPRPAATEGGFWYSNIRNAVYANNVVALGTVNGLRLRQCPAGSIPSPVVEDCDTPAGPPGPPLPVPCLSPLPSGYRRAWFNNRDLNGNLLPVRFMENGVDGNALEPQWPD